VRKDGPITHSDSEIAGTVFFFFLGGPHNPNPTPPPHPPHVISHRGLSWATGKFASVESMGGGY